MLSAHKEMLRFVVPVGVIAALLIFLVPPLLPTAWFLPRMALYLGGILAALLCLFIIYFFRDPDRVVPADPNLIVSAADGTVVSISEMEEPDFHLGPMIRIAIFLSVFDVHINRSPVAGRGQEHRLSEREISRCAASRRQHGERMPGMVAGDRAWADRREADRRPDRAPHRHLDIGGCGAFPRRALWDDPVRIEDGGLRPARQRDFGPPGRPGRGRGHADRALAGERLIR